MFGIFDKSTRKNGSSSAPTVQDDKGESSASEKRLPPSTSFGNLTYDGDDKGKTPTTKIETKYQFSWHKKLVKAYENLDVPAIKDIVDCTLLYGSGNFANHYKNKALETFSEWLDRELNTWSQYSGVKGEALELRISLLSCLKQTFYSQNKNEKALEGLWNVLIQRYKNVYPERSKSPFSLPECKG